MGRAEVSDGPLKIECSGDGDGRRRNSRERRLRALHHRPRSDVEQPRGRGPGLGHAPLGVFDGTVPPLLVGAGLWLLRTLVADERRAAFRALSFICVAMFLFAAMNSAFRAIGPPFDLFLLAPASVVAALTARKGPIRALLGLLAAAYCAALVMALFRWRPPTASVASGSLGVSPTPALVCCGQRSE